MSKIIVDTIESTGTTVTVNDGLASGAINAGTNAITAGSVTGLTATSITSGTLGAAAEWTQIGDDVVISGSSSALKAISTTGLYWVGVTVTPAAGSSTITHAMLRQA